MHLSRIQDIDILTLSSAKILRTTLICQRHGLTPKASSTSLCASSSSSGMVCLNGLDGRHVQAVDSDAKTKCDHFFLEMACLTIIFGGNNDVRAVIPF